MGKILVHRPQGMRFTMLREELLRFFDWNHCAAYIAHKLETDTSHRLDDMEKRGVSEGLLWVEISEEFLRTDMLNAFSIRTIRDTLSQMEEKGVIVRSKGRIGKISSILYNYGAVDLCVTSGISMSKLPKHDPGKIAGVDNPEVNPGSTTGNFAGTLAGVDGGIKNVGKEEEEKEEEPPVVPQESQPQNPEDPPPPTIEEIVSEQKFLRELSATLDEEDSGAEPRKPFKRQWGRKQKKPEDPNSQSARLHRMPSALIPSHEPKTASPHPEIPVPVAPNQNPPVILPVPGVIVAEWNNLVPSCPAKWSDTQDGHLLRKAMADVQFLDSYRDLFAKAELINQNSDRGPWLTLQAMLSNAKNGQPHWYRIYSGQYAGMMKPQTKRGKEPDFVARRVKEREERHARENAVGKAD